MKLGHLYGMVNLINFFNLMELAFAEEKTTNMRLMMTSMQALSGLKSGNDLEKLYAFYKKIFL